MARGKELQTLRKQVESLSRHLDHYRQQLNDLKQQYDFLVKTIEALAPGSICLPVEKIKQDAIVSPYLLITQLLHKENGVLLKPFLVDKDKVKELKKEHIKSLQNCFHVLVTTPVDTLYYVACLEQLNKSSIDTICDAIHKHLCEQLKSKLIPSE